LGNFRLRHGAEQSRLDSEQLPSLERFHTESFSGERTFAILFRARFLRAKNAIDKAGQKTLT